MPTFRDSQVAFTEAIEAGTLSADPDSPVFAGRFMYMYTEHGRDTFKNINTREYLFSSSTVGDAEPIRKAYLVGRYVNV